MSDKVEVPKDLLEKLIKDPEYLKRAIRSDDLESFKSKYGVYKSSGLRCPACNQYGKSGGALWWHPETPTCFVCRKCKLVWQIECETKPIEEVIQEIKGK